MTFSQAAFAPIRSAPTFADGTATGTPAVLFVDSTADAYGVSRRFEVTNLSTTTGTLTVLLVAKGASVAGMTVAQGRRIMPGTTWSAIINGSIRVAVVGDAAYNAMLSDY